MTEQTQLPHPRFLEIIAALNAAEVRYVIIGGVAMRLHGSAHITDDMDFCYDRAPDNLSRLSSALSPYSPSLRGAPPGLPFVLDQRTLRSGLNFTLSTVIGALDILGEVPGIESLLDDLVTMKRAAGRDKDHKHLIEIEHIGRSTEAAKGNNTP